MGTSVGDIIMVLEKVLPLLKAIQNQQTGTQVPENAPTQPTTPQAELEKILEIIKVFTGKDGIPPLDQVNGALGETIGTMLNGKKTAIGTIGALLTTLLTQAPQLSTALGGIIGLGAATPVAPVVLPIFLALTGWGVLGKLEKWTQTIAKR